MNYYRFRVQEPLRSPDSDPVGVVSLFEVDDDGAPVRQIDIDEWMFLTPTKFTRDRPETGGRGRDGTPRRMRTEPFHLKAIESNRITVEEFDLSWSTEQYRARDYHEFKWMVLVNAREQGYLQEVFFEANAWYPNRPLSECVAISERAINELVAEGLIQLGSDYRDPQSHVIPREQHDTILRDPSALVYLGDEGPKAWLDLTDKGLEVFNNLGRRQRIP